MATKRGRPAFNPTAAQRRTVAIAAGGGMAHDEIALGLGISTPTLAKHFAVELSIGANAKRLEVLEAMHRAAKKGNVTAQRAYMALDPKLAAPPADTLKPEKPAPEGQAADATKTPVLGKKEQAQVDAVTAAAGTEWATLLPTPGGVQ